MTSFRPLAMFAAALGALGLSSPALAHPGHALGTGALTGFVHPFTGLDHLTAMVCVGLWAARAYPGKALALPAAFMAAMVAGFAFGRMGLAVPAEPVILVSMPLLALGAIFAPRVKLGLAMAITGFFALAHGFAHAAEASGSHFAFGMAMLVATALLHGFGLALGRGLDSLGLRRRA
ncbi:HupE/UreJ family protein [Novosphingobium profundi]|uniref:HupE/UreJ family protein n=1 Tax=Novosphingobium profundi TaxID=1774954 RepID=UPI001BDA181F|nr:HupE/UreJ family protein [Novosphingobium profundi]MBT0670268.1 HupE/UreJ family protein [Novosphingobium profundi]